MKRLEEIRQLSTSAPDEAWPCVAAPATLFPNVISPKQNRKGLTGTATWYPYYAGFSSRFALDVLRSANLTDDARVLDVWNGAGTTTSTAREIGLNAVGLDRNPVMLLAARARLLSPGEGPSIGPLAMNVLAKARSEDVDLIEGDPLCTWLMPASVTILRRIEAGVQELLVSTPAQTVGAIRDHVSDLSDLAAFFYVALFRTVRDLLRQFVPSNPTWTKRPSSPRHRLRPDAERIFQSFLGNVLKMGAALGEERDGAHRSSRIDLLLGDSRHLPLADASVDFILSSPPYCTRIDYAVATMPELAVLGFGPDSDLQVLRRQLIGSATVPSEVTDQRSEWGTKCNEFLRKVAAHPSKASGGYYYKNHVQYFSFIYRSLQEVARVLSSGSRCVLVVQDSFYKDIHNKLPSIFEEMLSGLGVLPEKRMDFSSRQLMVNINSRARRYRRDSHAVESVLTLRKQ